jgi:hypothetical protein
VRVGGRPLLDVSKTDPDLCSSIMHGQGRYIALDKI